MTLKTETLRYTLEQRKGQKQQIESLIRSNRKKAKEAKRDLRFHEQARELLREAGLKTQESLSFHISEITSLALEAVFDEPYQLDVEFVQRRNKTECDLFFVRDEQKIDPMDASGGGAVDVATFALRIASWSMNNPRLRNTIILDEPLKNLSKEYQEKGSAMLKEVSKRLGIQFIIVTHEKVLAAHADKTFEIGIREGKSRILNK
jgi:predicted ABC-type transport system involved in lysophospholipase L1 biosynthesis ATPase subunit